MHGVVQPTVVAVGSRTRPPRRGDRRLPAGDLAWTYLLGRSECWIAAAPDGEFGWGRRGSLTPLSGGAGGVLLGTSTDQPPCHHIHSYAYRSMNGVRYQARAQRGIAFRLACAPCSGSHSHPGRMPSGTWQSPGEGIPRDAVIRGGWSSVRLERGVGAQGGTCRRPAPSHRVVRPVEIGLMARRIRRWSGPIVRPSLCGRAADHRQDRSPLQYGGSSIYDAYSSGTAASALPLSATGLGLRGSRTPAR